MNIAIGFLLNKLNNVNHNVMHNFDLLTYFLNAGDAKRMKKGHKEVGREERCKNHPKHGSDDLDTVKVDLGRKADDGNGRDEGCNQGQGNRQDAQQPAAHQVVGGRPGTLS